VKNEAQQAGFTLIEIVISIFIIVLMLVFYTSSFSTNQLARIQEHKDIALRVINQKMAAARAAGYSSVTGASFTDTQLSALTSYSASTTVSTYNASEKLVTVGVSWLESSTTNYYLGETTLLVNSGGL
jgi:prepilin-type N-terminal cleavage/methylation domain-containing protein